uniref:Uncharacterized protein n=1 Tax=Tetranychus urticae TaxID=32264 RepID=T1K402_TETUR
MKILESLFNQITNHLKVELKTIDPKEEEKRIKR